MEKLGINLGWLIALCSSLILIGLVIGVIVLLFLWLRRRNDPTIISTVKIDQPLNQKIIAYLQGSWKPRPVFRERINFADLHTHPDLIDRFDTIAENLPEGVTRGYIFGFVALANASGVIFATAVSMDSLFFRLDESTRQAAFGSLGKPIYGLDEWVSFNAWQVYAKKEPAAYAVWLEQMREWLRRGLEYANDLAGAG